MVSPVIEDPVMRQRYRLAREGDVLRLELWAEPGARVPSHFHPQIQERFEVLEGDFIFKVDGHTLRAGPGDTLVVEAGARHSFENAGTSVGHFVTEIEPALDMKELFEDSAALARAGMFWRPGIPRGVRGLLAAAEFVERYDPIYRQTFPPRFLQRMLFPPLARLARRRRRKGGR
jgi:quercetin dioxygenase-like cupin family protein